MKKAFLITSLFSLLVATPILASGGGNNDNNPVGAPNNNSTSKATTCDKNANWKNHGEYVSCVAHQHPGGQVVAEAARSDIGKNHPESSPEPSSPDSSASPHAFGKNKHNHSSSPANSNGSNHGKKNHQLKADLGSGNLSGLIARLQALIDPLKQKLG